MPGTRILTQLTQVTLRVRWGHDASACLFSIGTQKDVAWNLFPCQQRIGGGPMSMSNGCRTAVIGLIMGALTGCTESVAPVHESIEPSFARGGKPGGGGGGGCGLEESVAAG